MLHVPRREAGGGKEMVTNELGIGWHGKGLLGLYPTTWQSAPEKSQKSFGRSARAAVNHARA